MSRQRHETECVSGDYISTCLFRVHACTDKLDYDRCPTIEYKTCAMILSGASNPFRMARFYQLHSSIATSLVQKRKKEVGGRQFSACCQNLQSQAEWHHACFSRSGKYRLRDKACHGSQRACHCVASLVQFLAGRGTPRRGLHTRMEEWMIRAF